MTTTNSQPTPHLKASAPPAGHGSGGPADNAASRAATASAGQGGVPAGGGSWTAELEGAAADGQPASGAVRPKGVPVDTSPRQRSDGGPNHGNYKGG